MTDLAPGLIVLLGSGETLPSSGTTHEFVAQHLPPSPRIMILETPAGFEPNSDLVAGKIKDFLATRLQNYRPSIRVLPARQRGTVYSPDQPDIVAPILEADEILLGPGSPSYAVRQLKDSLALQMITARQRRGGALFLSSSAALAFGAYTIPVYEIYKVGEDLHWKQGLDFFGQYGLSLSIVPHWNNKDGGDELDTSRCYIGQARFEALLELLPENQTILGVDEHTSVSFDLDEGCCYVLGNGSVTILKDGQTRTFNQGDQFPLDVLGEWRLPAGKQGIPDSIWEMAIQAEAEREAKAQEILQPPDKVQSLVNAREQARTDGAWAKADELRAQVADLGWQIQDTPDGSVVTPLDDRLAADPQPDGRGQSS
jgi:cyanophycinase-like exopeptidase